MSKESVIALKSYERASFYRFFAIYASVFLLLFGALGLLYYFKEYDRLFTVQKVKNRIEFDECRRLEKMMGGSDECKMALIESVDGIHGLYRELLVAFGLVIFLVLPSGYYLAMLSLRPMRDSIDTIDSFINGIVHDVNTPLSIIKLSAQSMRPKLESERLMLQNTRILQSVADIEALEEQLSFTLKSDRYVLKKECFDLYKVLEMRCSYWNDVRSSVTIKFKGESCLVEADRAILMRMIDNIVFNAIKFSHRDSEVTVGLFDGVLEIEDRGIGIKNPDAIFVKYYRENHSVKGLGLGLFIALSVATLHAVSIRVRSKVGTGTTFYIDLKPIVKEAL